MVRNLHRSTGEVCVLCMAAAATVAQQVEQGMLCAPLLESIAAVGC
jgi:hypothetical protein